MKRHARRRTLDIRKILSVSVPILFIAAAISGFIPQVQQLWQELLQRADLSHFTAALPEDELHIHVIDVGKADAILVESPDAAILVDTGTQDSADRVLRYLSARNISELDAVWISHADSDHVGGLQTVLQSVQAKEIIRSPFSVLPDPTLETVPATVGEKYTYGDMTFDVLGPELLFEAENDNSLVFRLQYGEFTMLFCGDIEEKAEDLLLDSGSDLHADVLKVAHHGSNTSSSREFLQAVNPAYAVISVGEDRNDLPRNAVLKRLNDAEIPYFRTDEDGSIVITTDGTNIHITTENAGIIVGG